MNGRSGPLSPNSTQGSDWSGVSQYGHSPYSPNLPNQRGKLATPPISGSSNGTGIRMSNGMMNRPPGPGQPSPPNSIARSSYGTNMSTTDSQRRKTLQMEEKLSQHYSILKRFLAQSLRDEKGNPKPNRARDKLLRLSPVQFQELSTDVYDELLRRQSSSGQQRDGPGQVPPYLLPKENFHPKRNQARQKLATLPPPRFQDLATDVFYELERRFPMFAARDISRNGSPALSMHGGPPGRIGTPTGMRPSYGPRNASLGSQVMAGLGIPGVDGENDQYGRPMAKTFQSSTIVPNKSTMVEDDDDDTSDIYGSRRDTSMTSRSMGGSEKDRKIAEFESQVGNFETRIGELQVKVTALEEQLREKDSALDDLHRSRNQEHGVSLGQCCFQSKSSNRIICRSTTLNGRSGQRCNPISKRSLHKPVILTRIYSQSWTRRGVTMLRPNVRCERRWTGLPDKQAEEVNGKAATNLWTRHTRTCEHNSYGRKKSRLRSGKKQLAFSIR